MSDVVAIARSLAARSAYLHHGLMKLAPWIPADTKVRGQEKQLIFREAPPVACGQDPPPSKQDARSRSATGFRSELDDRASEVLRDRECSD